MSSAKWHPSEGEFGVLGDWEEGSPESRAAESQADKGIAALQEYRGDVEGRRGDISDYYSGQEELQEQEYGLRRESIGLKQEQLGVARGQVGAQESQALTQFLGDAYSFRGQSDVQRATGGLAFSGGQERGVERRKATMSDLMKGRQEQSDLQRQGLDISGSQLGLEMEGLDISQAKDYADLMKSKGIELAGIEDLLYQLETEEISYEGV